VSKLSEEKNEKTEQTGSKTPAKKRVRGNNRIARWFREMRSEMKKVVWPTPRQILNSTIIALSVMAVAAVAIWALDQVGMQIFQAIISLAGK